MTRVYLDVDGVLLGHDGGRVALARHAATLIDFILDRFDVYWLTTHCSGDVEQVHGYLRRFAPPEFMARLRPIKPTRFKLLKTEALQGDFYWLDDSPLQAELADLKKRDMFDRWIEVNTRQRPDDLLFAIEELSAISQTRQAGGNPLVPHSA